LADFPIYYWQFVSGAVRLPVAVKVIVEMKGYLFYCFLLSIKKRKLGVAGLTFGFTFQLGLFPREPDIARLEGPQRPIGCCVLQDAAK